MDAIGWFLNIRTSASLRYSYLLGSWLLLNACRFTEYKHNDGRIPAVQLVWMNEKAENRVIYTGSTDMKIRVRSERPIQQPYTIQFSYRDGYTLRYTVLPTHTGQANTMIDTTYTFVTKQKIDAYDDSQIAVSALIRCGKYGLSVTKQVALGMSLNWLVKVGNCSYSDGAGNLTDFGSIIWHYQPVRPETSSSGTYNGGAEVKKEITGAQRDSLQYYLRALVLDTTYHLSNRLKGTSLLQFKHGGWHSSYIIAQNSPQKELLERFLKATMQKR